MQRLFEPDAYGPEARRDCFWPLPAGKWPRVDGDMFTDFAIVGGGFTGLSAALHLAKAGADALVLEAEQPGWGASGRNGGFCCLGGTMLSHGALARRFGMAAADQFAADERAAIDLVRSLLEQHGINAETHSDGELQLAHSPGAAKAFPAAARLLERHGIKSDILSRRDLAERQVFGPEFHGGLHVKAGFALNPAAYAAGLAQAAAAAGADIRAQSPVQAISHTDGVFHLTTSRGVVTARHLIVATNGYSSDDVPDWLRARFLPMQSNIIVTRPLSPAEQQAQGWSSDLMAYDTRRLLHYFRRLPDGRFLFGMRGGLRADPRTQRHMRRATQQHFTRMFPAWAQVEVPHFWSGLINLTRGGTPYIGPIGDWDRAWAGLGYHGNGVAMGTFAGARLAALALGREQAGPVFSAPLQRFPFGRARRLALPAAFLGSAILDRV
ncbi:MAG TPA: FAD-binding oxidoreductase [Aliiroseovarius sp.]|nr:FAD-binding oxidoreductase [Aliiroseovarius sp.]